MQLQFVMGAMSASVEVSRGRQGRLVLEKPDRIKRRLKARFAQVLGASALLAYLREEPGAEMVQKALSAGVDVDGMQADL
jgi:hypothetical protein